MLPDGRLFIAGPHDPTHRFDLAAPAAAESFATIHGNRSTGGEKGTSVLLILRPPDYKPIVYIIGGNTPTTQQTAEMIDLSAPTPAWTALPDLNVPRAQQFTATLLPDGRVFIAGGVSGGADGGVCEIFDPRNPGAGWVVGPGDEIRAHVSLVVHPARRRHHRRWRRPAGRRRPDPARALLPRLLRHAAPGRSARRRPRSTMAAVSRSTRRIRPTSPKSCCCVPARSRTATTCRSVASNAWSAAIGAGTLDVEAPPHANLAPPGWYLLFILNASRVPSLGRWIRLTP